MGFFIPIVRIYSRYQGGVMFYSPLRYPGGKSKLTPYVQDTIEINNLEGGAYIEPFAGGAAIAWYLLLNNTVKKVYINDLNPSIYAFWLCVLNRTNELCKRIEDVEVSVREWHYQRSIYRSESSTLIERGFATFFLNRTNHSGIISGGPIGGFGQAGPYLIDCRFNKPDLISRINRIAKKKRQIILSNLDGAEFINEIVPNIEGKCLVNIDPRYYVKGQDLYQNFFCHEDHVRLRDSILSIKKPWILTYDDTPEICQIYHNHAIRSFGLRYSASKKRTGHEIIIRNPTLTECSHAPNITFTALKKAKRRATM